MAQLPDELVREILLRVTPDDPACLLRAAVVCKSWRRILADPDFRCHHRELHPTPHATGFLRIIRNAIPYWSRFESTDPSTTFRRRPAARDLPGWLAVDCRHGRALFAAPAPGASYPAVLDLIVWNPLTDERRRLPQPSPLFTDHFPFNAAVLCAATAQGCDHRGCHRGPFRVVFVFSIFSHTCARVYSSETECWSYVTYSPPSYNIYSIDKMLSPSVLVGDALYFSGSGNDDDVDDHTYVVEYQVTTHRLLAIYRPQSASLMAMADGGLHFTTLLEDPLRLCLWSTEQDPEGFEKWVEARAFNLETLLPKDTLTPRFNLTGSVEGADIIFVIVYKNAHHRGDVYMVHLNSGKITKVFEGHSYVFPYKSFCIPVIDEAYTGEEPREVVTNCSC